MEASFLFWGGVKVKETVYLFKSIFLQGYTAEKNIMRIPLSIIEIIFYSVYFVLDKLNIQFIMPYALEVLIIAIIIFNIYYMMFGRNLMLTESIRKYAASTMFVLLLLTYPILAEFPEIQSKAVLLKILLNVAWITDLIKEYIFFNEDKYFNRTMTTLFIMVCIIVQVELSYLPLLIPFFLIVGNLINILRIIPNL